MEQRQKYEESQLNKMVWSSPIRKDLEKVRCELCPGESFLGGGNGQCKGPGVAVCSVC